MADAPSPQETGFHPRTSVLSDDMVEYGGFWLASSYGDPLAEYEACRERAAVIDLSSLRKFEVLGPDAGFLLQSTVTRDVRRMSDRQVTYTAMCRDDGTMIDDGTLMRLGPDNYRWIGNSDIGGEWLEMHAAAWGLRAYVRPSTYRLHNIGVQGPRSKEIVGRIVWTPPAFASASELGWFRMTIGRIRVLDGTPLVLSRTGYSGELGYEIWCAPDDAPTVWDAVFEAGEEFDISPLGLEALDTLRVEAGLVFTGCEFDETTDPFQAGIGFTVDLDSNAEDFIGREALQDRKENLDRTVIGLTFDGDELAVGTVTSDGVEIGEITSSVSSPRFGSISLARLATTHMAGNTPVRAGDLTGRVSSLPFYDPDKTRPRGTDP